MTTGAKAVLNATHGALVFDRRIRILAAHLARSIPGGGKVLDLGCGDGSMGVLLMQLRPDLEVVGTDVFPRPKLHIPFTEYDGETLPFEDRKFDYVTMVDVLHHTNDPARVLSEAARVTRHGVVIKDHLLEGFLAGPTLRLMDWVGNRGHGVALPYNYLSNAQWRECFEKAGLVHKTWTERLGLYPLPFSWLFERGLHFVALMTPQAIGNEEASAA
jgi:SAM-dependent methyltransferase